MIIPEHLKTGDSVALVAPSSPVTTDVLETSVNAVKYLGLEPVVYESCQSSLGYLAGEDSLRADDINRAFGDKNIKGIFCLRGGYGSMRILNLLDYQIIRSNPKVFIGYSDITALHSAINKKGGFITYHGPMPTTDYTVHAPYTLDSLRKNLFSSFEGKVYNPDGIRLEVLSEGKAKGPLTGGNLSLLASLCGTPYEPDTDGKILFIEDVSEEPYRVDRNLTALKLSGFFDKASAVIFGQFTDCEPRGEFENNIPVKDIIKDIISDCHKPVIANFNAGHVYPQPTLPMGAIALIDTDKEYIEFKEK